MKRSVKFLTVIIAFALLASFSVNLLQAEEKKEEKAKECYVCPKAECKVYADKAGKCSKCGAELVKHECKSEFVCSMKACDYKTDKAGKCPKCSMELKEIKPECCAAKEEEKKGCDKANKSGCTPGCKHAH